MRRSLSVFVQGYAWVVERVRACNRAALVAPALGEIQPCLGRGVAHPAAGIDGQRYVQAGGEPPADLHRLVEAAFAETPGMQGHGQDQVGKVGGVDRAHDLLGKEACQGELSAVFQALHQHVGRMSVSERRPATLERRRAFETGAADLPGRGGQGTDRTARGGQAGQVIAAVRAERAAQGTGAAQQTGLRDDAAEPQLRNI